MLRRVRVAVITSLAVVAAVVLTLMTTATTAGLALAAAAGATALIMGGTGHPLSTPPDTLDYVEFYTGVAVNNYIAPASRKTPATGMPVGPYNRVAVITPEQFAPDYGTLTYDESVEQGVVALNNCIRATGCVYNPGLGSEPPSAADSFVVFGFSQSSTIAMVQKRNLAAEYAAGQGPDVSFLVLANGNRPNGGFLARGPQGFTIPWPLKYAGATFSGPAPTNTQYATVDFARQYDGWSDFPLNPLNLLADANAFMGITYLHVSDDSVSYLGISLDDPSTINQGRYGDTTYYLAPTPILPLLIPVEHVPLIGYALADALDPPLRVLVEAGYNRALSPGQPAGWNLLYLPNPIKLTADFLVAIPVGVDNGMQDLFGVRPFGTRRPGPFGVGGGSAGTSSGSPAAARPSTATAVAAIAADAVAPTPAAGPRDGGSEVGSADRGGPTPKARTARTGFADRSSRQPQAAQQPQPAVATGAGRLHRDGNTVHAARRAGGVKAVSSAD